jgi:arsenite methyltransferase
MNTVAPGSIQARVRNAYSAAALEPAAKHAFPTGRIFAESLGYPPERLASLPAVAVDAFAGVAHVSLFAKIPPGAVVLDLGCGAGLDTLIAARRTGPRGTVVGVDFSFSMLARAEPAASEVGLDNVVLCHSDAEGLPLADSSIDVAIVNGIFNLNPARRTIFHELGRVVRAGGAVYATELILGSPLPHEVKTRESDWFA